jgi:hypothetical protein
MHSRCICCAFVLALASLGACGSDAASRTVQGIYTSDAGNPSFIGNFTKKTTVDYGDGSPQETFDGTPSNPISVTHLFTSS